jgi:hypothetical protein
MDGVVRRGPASEAQPRTAPGQTAPRKRPQPLPKPAPIQASQPGPVSAKTALQSSQSTTVQHTSESPRKRSQSEQYLDEKSPSSTRKKRSRKGAKVFFQTLLALVVILGVAVAIVVLYLRYYQ